MDASTAERAERRSAVRRARAAAALGAALAANAAPASAAGADCGRAVDLFASACMSRGLPEHAAALGFRPHARALGGAAWHHPAQNVVAETWERDGTSHCAISLRAHRYPPAMIETRTTAEIAGRHGSYSRNALGGGLTSWTWSVGGPRVELRAPEGAAVATLRFSREARQ